MNEKPDTCPDCGQDLADVGGSDLTGYLSCPDCEFVQRYDRRAWRKRNEWRPT